MRRLPKNLTHRYNRRYGGVGGIFQGPYQSRHIETQNDLRNVTLYVTIKNTMERYPEGGIEGAIHNFETAQMWSNEDPFSSFPEYAQYRKSPIVEVDDVYRLYPKADVFIKEARDYLMFV